MGSRLEALFDAGNNGDAMTPANSGLTAIGGNNSGNTATLSTAAAWHGGLGGLFKTVASGNVAGCFGTLNYDVADTRQSSSFVLLMPLARPSADFIMASWRDSANTSILRVFIRASDGGLYITDPAAGTYSQLAAAGDFAYNTKYRLTLTATVGTTTSNGAFTAKLRKQSDQSAVGTTVTRTDANLGTNPFFRILVGISGNSLGYQVGIDDLQIQSGTTTELGDWTPPANNPPIVNAGADQTVAIGTSLSRTASATDADGTIASQQWVCTSRPAAVSTTPTFPAGATFSYTYPQPGTYVFTFTATDNDGDSDSDSVTITALAASAPTAVANQTIGPGVIDARASSSAAGGALSYSISPAGPTQITPGVWYQQPGATAQPFTVTVTEAGSGQSATAAVTIAAINTDAPYTGSTISLDLPVPGDAASNGTWADDLNREVRKLEAAVQSVQAYIANPTV